MSSADPDALFEAGRRYSRDGDLESTESAWREASQASHHGAAFELGLLLEQKGELDGAADEWGFAAKSPDSEVAIKAIANYGRLIGEHEFDTDNVVGSHRVAKSIRGHDTAEADRLWRLAAESEHEDGAWAWIGLGRLYDPTELADDPDPAKSLDSFEKAAASKHPDAAPCGLLKLGRLQESLGRQEGGAEGGLNGADVLKRGAGSGHPEWAPRCALQLAGVHADRGDLDAARPWWEMAASSDLGLAEIAQRQLDDLDSGGADPLDDVDTLLQFEPNEASVYEAFDIALQSLGWSGGVEGVGGYSHVRREGNADHLYCIPRKRLLSRGGGRIEVFIKQRDGEKTSIGLVGGTARDREAFQRAITHAVQGLSVGVA